MRFERSHDKMHLWIIGVSVCLSLVTSALAGPQSPSGGDPVTTVTVTNALANATVPSSTTMPNMRVERLVLGTNSSFWSYSPAETNISLIELTLTGRGTNANANWLRMAFNGDYTLTYDWYNTYGDKGTAPSRGYEPTNSTSIVIGYIPGDNHTNTFSVADTTVTINAPSYVTGLYKGVTFNCRSAIAANVQGAVVGGGRWENTAAITNYQFWIQGGAFLQSNAVLTVKKYFAQP